MEKIFFLLKNNNHFYHINRLKYFFKDLKNYNSGHEITLLDKTDHKKITIEIYKHIKIVNNKWTGYLLIFIFYYGYETDVEDFSFNYNTENYSRKKLIKEFNHYIYSKLFNEIVSKKYDIK